MSSLGSRWKTIELLALTFIMLVVIGGLIASYVDLRWFEGVYVREDGIIENITALALFAGFCLCLVRAFKLRKLRPSTLILGTSILAGVFLFGAGEEISWGQRIIGHESPEFFQAHNSQKETNIHNLMVSGKKINKIVFGLLLGIGTACYFLILPTLYRKVPWVQRLVDRWGVPVPRNLHSGALVILFILASLVISPKKGELVEFGGCLVFLLVVVNPLNRQIFEIGPSKSAQ